MNPIIDKGYEQRLDSILSQRSKLQEALGEPSVPTTASMQPLSLLGEAQRVEASFFLLDLMLIVDNNSLAEFIEPGEWFYDLTAIQREQVIDHYRGMHLGGHDRIILNWYETYGPKGAFRFEKSLSPVASR